MLFNFAIKNRYGNQSYNPARFTDRRKEKRGDYHTWTDDEIRQFLAVHGPGTKARLAFMIFFCTGASRKDFAGLGWQHVRNGRVRFRRSKTGELADLPILPELDAELQMVPGDQLLFLTHGEGRPYKPETLGNWFKDQCLKAELHEGSSHGLRKAGATRLAESGATEMEIVSFLAHKDSKEAHTYWQAANRAKLADRGMARLPRLKDGQNLSNPSKRLDTRATQVPEKDN